MVSWSTNSFEDEGDELGDFTWDENIEDEQLRIATDRR